MTPDHTKSGTRGRSRDRLLNILKIDGPRTAGALAETLGLTDMAVRQHLHGLKDNGLVGYTLEPRPVGRPAKLWALTDGADGFFPSGYADLAVNLVSSVTQAFGAQGMEALLKVRAKEQIGTYRRAMDAKTTLKDKLTALAEIRTREGYMADLKPDPDGGYLLVENHCPICSVARACSGLCASELEVFQAVLGERVEITRSDHILAGARRCAYRVRPGRP